MLIVVTYDVSTESSEGRARLPDCERWPDNVKTTVSVSRIRCLNVKWTRRSLSLSEEA